MKIETPNVDILCNLTEIMKSVEGTIEFDKKGMSFYSFDSFKFVNIIINSSLFSTYEVTEKQNIKLNCNDLHSIISKMKGQNVFISMQISQDKSILTIKSRGSKTSTHELRLLSETFDDNVEIAREKTKIITPQIEINMPSIKFKNMTEGITTFDKRIIFICTEAQLSLLSLTKERGSSKEIVKKSQNILIKNTIGKQKAKYNYDLIKEILPYIIKLSEKITIKFQTDFPLIISTKTNFIDFVLTLAPMVTEMGAEIEEKLGEIEENE